MDNPVIYLVLLGLLFLLALVFGILSAKTWRWPDVVAGFLVFFLSMTFLILLSLSLKARRHWVRELHVQEARLENNEKERQQLVYGDLTETGQTESFTSLSARLSRFLLDRGRVWRDCVPAANPDETFTITIPGADATNPHGIPNRFILYLFREKILANGIVVPATFIGEFEVIAVSDTGVQLRPTLYAPDLRRVRETNQAGFLQTFIQFYIQANTQPTNHTWSLYETLPVDDHELYADPDATPDLAAVGEPAFGAVNAQEVADVVNTVANFSDAAPIDEAKRQSIIQRYLRDGTRAEPSDPPQNVYTKVRFTQKHAVKVDTDVVAAGDNVEFFDNQGQAQLEFLGVPDGDSVTMEVGQTALLPQAAANELIRANVCERIEDVYVRNLTDYTTMFRESHERVLELRNERFFIDRNLDLVSTTNQLLANLLQFRQAEKLRLEADLAKMTYEHQQIKSLTDQVATQLNTLKENIRELLGNSLSLEQQLETAQRYISENVERDVQQAVASP